MTTIFKLFIKFFPIVFILVFLFILAVFVWAFIGVYKEKNKNANAPRLTVDANVASKLCEVVGGKNAKAVYRAAFEVESGDILNLTVSEELFGSFAESESGRLTFCGGEFVSFEKK